MLSCDILSTNVAVAALSVIANTVLPVFVVVVVAFVVVY